MCYPCNRQYMREWRTEAKKDPAFVLKEQIKQKEWWDKNREWGNERNRIYKNTNERARLDNALRARVKYALVGCANGDKMFDLLGCTPKQWKAHLESQFNKNMSWDNYTEYWEIDHIIPIASFDIFNEEEQKKAYHYTNTQPLECYKNRRKHKRVLAAQDIDKLEPISN